MRTALIGLVALMVTNVPSLYYGWYKMWPWFDTVQHFLGGFFVAMFFWHYFKNYLGKNRFFNTMIIISLTVLIGVLWELAEYTANQTLVDPLYRNYGIVAYFQGDIRDTMMDFVMDIVGAGILMALHSFRGRNSHKR